MDSTPLHPADPLLYPDLVRWGYLRQATLASGNVELVEVEGGYHLELRHWDHEHGPDVLIKRPDPLAADGAPMSAAALRHELSFFSWVERLTTLHELLPWLIFPIDPLAADPRQVSSTFPLVRDARSLWGEITAVELGRGGAELGKALACLHRCSRGAVARMGDAAAPGRLPAVLMLDRPPPGSLMDLSPWQERILRIVQNGDFAFRDALPAARDAWRRAPRRCLIHGAVRAHNVLVTPGTATPGTTTVSPPLDPPRGTTVSPPFDPPRGTTVSPPLDPPRGTVRLVGWELFQAGDPTWDVGSALASFALYWLRSLPDDARAVELFQADFQTAVGGFLESYGKPSGSGTELRRATALHLLHDAWEAGHHGEGLDKACREQLQLAHSLLAEPDAAAILFGEVW